MDPFLISLIAKTGYDWWKSTQDDKKQQQHVDAQNATNAGQLKYMYDAMEQEKIARQEAMRLQQAMFEKSLAEQQRGTDMSALYAKGAMGMNLAGTLQQQQANLDQQIKLAQMQQAQTQPQRMAQASAMQALPQLQRLMGMTPYKLPTSTVENNYSTLGQNVLGDYFKTLQATQPFIDKMIPQQASNASTNPAFAPEGQTYTNAKPGAPQAPINDPAGFFDVPEYANIASREIRKVYGSGAAKRPDAEQIFSDYLARAQRGEFGGSTGAGYPTAGTNNGVTVGGAGLTAPVSNPAAPQRELLTINMKAPVVSQDTQYSSELVTPTRMNSAVGTAGFPPPEAPPEMIGNRAMPTQYTDSPTTITRLPEGGGFVMPINGVDHVVTAVTNTGQPVEYYPIQGAKPGVPTVNPKTVPTLGNDGGLWGVSGYPNTSTTGSNTGPATTTNPLEVDTELLNKPVSELIKNSPLYQYQSKENEDAIRRMMAQRGLLNSSHTLSATSKAAQALSANEADKQVSRLSAMYNAALGQPINMPTTQGFQLSNMGNTGQDMSSLGNIYNQAAQNRANSYSSFGNTMGNAITNAGQSAGQNMAKYGNAWAQGNTMSNLANYGMSNTGTDWGKTLIDLGDHYGWGQTTSPKSSGVSSSFNNILSGFGSLWR